MGRTWTISDPKGFRETVKDVAPKLGEGYSEFIHKAVYDRVKRLKDEDFEMAKKRVELVEKKKQLNTVRERETTWLREKGHKKKNIKRVLEDLDDPELEEEFLDLIKDRERIAEEVIELDKEVNPSSKPKKRKKRSKEWYLKRARELGLRKKKSKKSVKSEERRIRKELEAEGRDEANVEDVMRLIKNHAEQENMSLWEAYEELLG